MMGGQSCGETKDVSVGVVDPDYAYVQFGPPTAK